MTAITIDIDNLDATERIGRQLGSCLQAGDVVALIGPLGSGKTTLVQRVAAGAGVADLRQVNSPTFVIINEYEAGDGAKALRLYHVDAYRLRGSDDLEALGFDEMVGRGAVLVEWADKVTDVLPADRLAIAIEVIDGDRRRFHCTAAGARAKTLIERLRSV